jgi:hypothetical protein
MKEQCEAVRTNANVGCVHCGRCQEKTILDDPRDYTRDYFNDDEGDSDADSDDE